MPRIKKSLLASLSVADLKALLAARERSELLEARRVELQAELRQVDRELAQLAKGGVRVTRAGKKRASAKSPAKKVRNQVAAKPRKSGGASVEAVVIDLLKANGGPMGVPDILATIKKQKLVKTKAANFAGVVRQTICKSSRIKRVGRGIYKA